MANDLTEEERTWHIRFIKRLILVFIIIVVLFYIFIIYLSSFGIRGYKTYGLPDKGEKFYKRGSLLLVKEEIDDIYVGNEIVLFKEKTAENIFLGEVTATLGNDGITLYSIEDSEGAIKSLRKEEIKGRIVYDVPTLGYLFFGK